MKKFLVSLFFLLAVPTVSAVDQVPTITVTTYHGFAYFSNLSLYVYADSSSSLSAAVQNSCNALLPSLVSYYSTSTIGTCSSSLVSGTQYNCNCAQIYNGTTYNRGTAGQNSAPTSASGCPSNSTRDGINTSVCDCNSGYIKDSTGTQCVVNACASAAPISGTYSSNAALSSTLCIGGCLVISGFDAVSSGTTTYYFLNNVTPSSTACTGSLTTFSTTTASSCLAHGQYASTVNGVTVCTDTAPTGTTNVSIVPPPPTLNCQTEPYYCASHNLTDGNGYSATCNTSGVCSAVAPTNAIAGTGAVSSVASTTTTCTTNSSGVQTCTGTTTTSGTNTLDVSTLNKESTQQQIASSLNTIAANSDFCAKNPNSASCSTLGSAPAGDALQTKTVDVSQTNWSAFSFTGNAICPADYVLQLHGGAPSLTFSYAPVCSFMNIFRPIAIAIAFYVAGLILLGRKES